MKVTIVQDEIIVELTDEERKTLAYHASSAAHALDDFRYNGLMDASNQDMFAKLDTGKETHAAQDAWQSQRPAQLDEQKHWRLIAHILDPESYDEEGKHRA